MHPEYREVKKAIHDIAFEIKVNRNDPEKIMEQYIRLIKLATKMEETHAIPTRNENR